MRDKTTSKLTVRGFIRGQIVDSKTKKIVGDSGWVENKLTNDGLTDLARLLGAVSGSYVVGYAAVGTQNTAVDMTQTDLVGRINSFRALNLATSGTATLTCTASFAGTALATTYTVAAAGLFKTNSVSSLFALQTFTGSAWATGQNFNLTYQIRFATA